MDETLVVAGCMLYNSVMCLLRFPGGLANVVKTDGGWLFLHADITSLCISMAVLLLRMTVGPTFWKEVKERARIAMCVATISMAIAAHHVFIRLVRFDHWLRAFVTGIAFGAMGLTCVSLFILWSCYGRRVGNRH